MKQIKNGKIYDTEQSDKIVKYSNGGSKRDFRFIRETLYKTENGNYFLHGRGGAKTQYSNRTQNGISGGEEIKPMSEQDCIEWAEDRSVEVDPIVREFSSELEQG